MTGDRVQSTARGRHVGHHSIRRGGSFCDVFCVGCCAYQKSMPSPHRRRDLPCLCRATAAPSIERESRAPGLFILYGSKCDWSQAGLDVTLEEGGCDNTGGRSTEEYSGEFPLLLVSAWSSPLHTCTDHARSHSIRPAVLQWSQSGAPRRACALVPYGRRNIAYPSYLSLRLRKSGRDVPGRKCMLHKGNCFHPEG